MREAHEVADSQGSFDSWLIGEIVGEGGCYSSFLVAPNLALGFSCLERRSIFAVDP